jgi:hypothetical protein
MPLRAGLEDGAYGERQSRRFYSWADGFAVCRAVPSAADRGKRGEVAGGKNGRTFGSRSSFLIGYLIAVHLPKLGGIFGVADRRGRRHAALIRRYSEPPSRCLTLDRGEIHGTGVNGAVDNGRTTKGVHKLRDTTQYNNAANELAARGGHAEVLTSNRHHYFANCRRQQLHREYQRRRRESAASRQLVRHPTRQSRSACML